MASEPGPKRLTNVARIATPSRPAVRTHARPPRAMARQKEQPEPTNEPGDPPPAEPKKPAADDVAVCLVRPRPREKRDDNRTLEHGGSSTAALDFRSAEGGRGVALASAPGAPAREPVAASGSRRRGWARARRRGRLARSPAPAPRPTPSPPRAGEPRAFSASKAPLPSAHRPIPSPPDAELQAHEAQEVLLPRPRVLRGVPEGAPRGPPRGTPPPKPRRTPRPAAISRADFDDKTHRGTTKRRPRAVVRPRQ